MSWLLPAARFCFWLTKPDPPIVRKAKTVYRETRAWSELVNTVLPEPPSPPAETDHDPA